MEINEINRGHGCQISGNIFIYLGFLFISAYVAAAFAQFVYLDCN